MKTFWVHENWKWQKENSTAKYIDERCTEAVTLADAQETIAELMEALECVLTEKPLPSGEYVHLVSCNGDRRKPAGTIGVSCSCRVGRATIAALQARVKELCKFRQADHEQLVEVQKYWRESQDEVHELQSQLTQRTAERDALKLVNDTHMKTVMKLSHVVEQRTAELEAANKKREDTRKAFLKIHESFNDQSNKLITIKRECDNLQAELERVRDQFADLRKMVAALPKVEGEIEIHTFKTTNQVVVTYNRGIIIGTLYGLDHAKPVAALYEHRQGMEG